jgi:MtN3 and saliva related transmembrane protein
MKTARFVRGRFWKTKQLRMNPVTLGLVAGAFTTFSSLPQIISVLKTRSMKDISIVTLCMFASGVSLWLCYGIVIHALPVIFWNALSLSLYGVQIFLKLALNNSNPVFAWRRERVSVALSA